MVSGVSRNVVKIRLIRLGSCRSAIELRPHLRDLPHLKSELTFSGMNSRARQLESIERPCDRVGIASRATRIALLNRRASDRTIRAKHATIARLWFQAGATTLAVVEKLTCIYWHRLQRLMSAPWTSDRRFKLNHDCSSGSPKNAK